MDVPDKPTPNAKLRWYRELHSARLNNERPDLLGEHMGLLHKGVMGRQARRNVEHMGLVLDHLAPSTS